MWTQKADVLGGTRCDAAGFSIGCKGYIGTGEGSIGFWEYDPLIDTWKKKATFGGANRDEAVGFSIGNKGYIGTGGEGSLTNPQQKDFWEYTPDFLNADFSANIKELCLGGCINFSDTSTDVTEWNWTFPGGTPPSSTSRKPINICYSNPGKYDVSLVVSNLCGNNTIIKPNFITITAPPVVDAGPDVTILFGTSTTLQATGGVSYVWSPITSLSAKTGSTVISKPDSTIKYYVEVKDSKGCKNSDSVNVFVFKSGNIHIPDAFSPNGDNKNDIFYVYAFAYQVRKIEINIFNRWGELIFSSNDLSKGWDGTYKNIPVQEDVYVCTVECTWIGGEHKTFKDKLTLIR